MIDSHRLEEGILKYSPLIVGLVVVAAFVGAGYYAYDFYKIKQESKAQLELYKADKLLNNLKEADAQALTEYRAELAKKKDKPSTSTFHKPEHDYTSIIEQYRKVIREYPNSQASLNAAISASDLFLEKKQYQEALSQLGVTDKNLNSPMLKKNSFLTNVIRLKIAVLFEAEGKCQANNINESVLKPILDSKKFDFLKPEALLRVALCADQGGNKDQAKEYYQKVIQQYPDTPASQDAEKYLLLLEVKG